MATNRVPRLPTLKPYPTPAPAQTVLAPTLAHRLTDDMRAPVTRIGSTR